MSLVFPEVAAPAPALPGRSMEPPERPPHKRRVVTCSCGCGRNVYVDDYVHYVDEDGNTFYDRDCVDKFYGIRCVD